MRYRESGSTKLVSRVAGVGAGLGILLGLALLAPAPALAQSGAKPAELVLRSDGTTQGVGGRYALVVGINDYARTGLGDLRFSEPDARAVRDTLVQHGGFPAGNVTLLLGEQASFEQIMVYLDRLSDREVFPQPDTFVLYFSGHGGILAAESFGPNAAGSADGYLIPADGSGNPQVARFRNIPLQEVQRLLDRSGFKRKVVLLDACRNVLQTDARSGGSFAAFNLAQYQLAEGLKVLAGAKPGQLSWEDETLGHGVFTYYLLQGLLGSGQDEHGVVTLAGLERAVSLGLAEYARRNPGRAQTPQSYGEGLGTIPLTLAPDSAAAQQLLAPPPAASLQSWVLTALKLPAEGQDPEVVKLAEQVLNERGGMLDRNKLPDAQWRAFETQLSQELARDQTALTAWLASYVQSRLGNDQATLTLAQQAVRLAPDWPRGQWLLGAAYHDRKRYDEALASYREAIRLDPQDARAHGGLGLLYRDLQRYDEAMSCYREAIRLDPQDARAHNELGIVYRALKRYDEAIASYMEAIRLNPNEQVYKDNLKKAQDAKARR